MSGALDHGDSNSRTIGGADRGARVVVVAPGCWCAGQTGQVVGPASGTPGYFTVALDDGRKFLARLGDVDGVSR
jgi:hypothetical protein